MQIRRFLYNSSLYLIANIASRVIGLLMIPVYARFLNPAEYGLVELIELTIQVVSIGFGLQSVGGAMIRIYHDAGTDHKREVVSTAMISAGLANLLIAAAGFALAEPLSSYILHTGSANTGLLRAGFAAMVLGNMIELALVYQRLHDRVGLYVTYALAQLVASASLNVYFIVYARQGVWGFVLSKLLVCAAGSLFLVGSVMRDTGIHWCGDAARKMARFGAPLILANLAFFVIHFSDRFFLSALRNLTEVGTYALAYRFAFLVSVIVGEPFGKVWSVNLYTYTSVAGWQDRFARIARYFVFALCFAGLAFSLFGGNIVRWMTTSAYYDAALVLPVLVSAYVLREVGDFFRDVLFINKRSRFVGFIALSAAMLNIALNIVLIRSFGMYGAAWSTFVTWLVYMVCCWAGARREHGIPFGAQAFLVPALLAAGLFLVAQFLPAATPALHASFQLIGLGSFIGLLWMFRYFPEHEQSVIREKLTFLRAGRGIWVKEKA